MDRGAWWAAVCRVAKSWTQLSEFYFSLKAMRQDKMCLEEAWIKKKRYQRIKTCKAERLGRYQSYSQTIFFIESVSHSFVSDSATPRTVARQAPRSMGLSWQECWSRLPFPSPGDLPNPETKPVFPALADGFSGKPYNHGTEEQRPGCHYTHLFFGQKH